MVDLRDYKDEVKKVLAELAVKDTNWKWNVKKATKSEILIGWGYLDYIGEKDLFKIEAVDLLEDGNNDFTSRDASGELIDLVPEKHGIKRVVESIFYYARSRY